MNGRQRGQWALWASVVILAACGTDALAPGPNLSAGDVGDPEAGALGDASDSLAADDAGTDAGTDAETDAETGTDDDAGAEDLLAADAAETADDIQLCGDCSELDGSVAGDAPEVSLDVADSGPACPGSTGCKCATDKDCPALGACLGSTTGLICAAPCQSGVPCAQGSTCVPLPGAATDGSQDKTVCAPKCSSPAPGPESCNGLDDDCNGLTDDGNNLCDDNNFCTADACKGGLCSPDPEDKPCDDGSACTSGDACVAGLCAGATVTCDDGNSCTDDSCDPAGGCTHKSSSGACDDGSVCTNGDQCKAAACVSAAISCDDGNACTVDSCDAKLGCTHTPVADPDCGIDPCLKNNGGCPAGQICSANDQGKANCTACPSGYVGQGATCVDVDECKIASSCDSNATCSNGAGTFTCACKAGWKQVGKICVDVDECADKTAGCAPTATCVNLPGSVKCTCAAGQGGDGKTCGNKGSSKVFPALSCLEIFTTYPGSADGVYWLDIDAAGATVSAQYLCDMKGGGWTLLMWDDFEDSTTKGWSVGPVTTCGKFGHILGGAGVFGKNASTQKTVLGPPHTQARLTLDFLRIDSWLFEQGFVQVDGNTVWTKKGTGGYLTGGKHECGKDSINDEKWDADWQGAHTAAALTLKATSDLNESASNEAFGIDNAVVWVK